MENRTVLIRCAFKGYSCAHQLCHPAGQGVFLLLFHNLQVLSYLLLSRDGQQEKMSRMTFCREWYEACLLWYLMLDVVFILLHDICSNNMLYPKEDQQNKILLLACNNCDHQQEATDMCVYRNTIKHSVQYVQHPHLNLHNPDTQYFISNLTRFILMYIHPDNAFYKHQYFLPWSYCIFVYFPQHLLYYYYIMHCSFHNIFVNFFSHHAVQWEDYSGTRCELRPHPPKNTRYQMCQV